jgi:hypothetical protein
VTRGRSGSLVQVSGQHETPRPSRPAPWLVKRWSPSGDRVADFATLTQGTLHKGDIAVVTVADGATTNLTNTPSIDEAHPEWSSH